MGSVNWEFLEADHTITTTPLFDNPLQEEKKEGREVDSGSEESDREREFVFDMD